MVYFNMEYNMVINYLFYLRYYIRLSTRLLLQKDFCQQVDNKELFENLFFICMANNSWQQQPERLTCFVSCNF